LLLAKDNAIGRVVTHETLENIGFSVGMSFARRYNLLPYGDPMLPLEYNCIKQQAIMECSVTEFPSSLPGIDVPSALARVAGNQKLYLKLLRRMATDGASAKGKLSAAIMENDAEQVRHIAHSIKGSASNLSIMEVAAAAEKLEQAARDGDVSMLAATHLAPLESALDAFIDVVSTLEDL